MRGGEPTAELKTSRSVRVRLSAHARCSMAYLGEKIAGPRKISVTEGPPKRTAGACRSRAHRPSQRLRPRQAAVPTLRRGDFGRSSEGTLMGTVLGCSARVQTRGHGTAVQHWQLDDSIGCSTGCSTGCDLLFVLLRAAVHDVLNFFPRSTQFFGHFPDCSQIPMQPCRPDVA